jgi:hypothetical protein
MATGLEIRAQIDTENVKGLVIINGGAAVALLAFLPAVLDKPEFDALARAVLWGLLIFQIGLFFAILHNRLRRICSLEYERHDYKPPACTLLGIKLKEPCTCWRSIICMWLSVVAFSIGGITVFLGGLGALDQRAKTKALAEPAQKHGVVSNSSHKLDCVKRGPLAPH